MSDIGDFKRAVDLQLVYARGQIDLSAQLEGYARQGAVQAALMQMHLGLGAYIAEVTNGFIQSPFVALGLIRKIDVATFDFRLQELQTLSVFSHEWLSQLCLASVAASETLYSPPPSATTMPATQLIATTGCLSKQWFEFGYDDLNAIYLAFKALIENQRNLSLEM